MLLIEQFIQDKKKQNSKESSVVILNTEGLNFI